MGTKSVTNKVKNFELSANCNGDEWDETRYVLNSDCFAA